MKVFDFLRKIRKNFSKYDNSIEVLISENNLLHNLIFVDVRGCNLVNESITLTLMTF